MAEPCPARTRFAIDRHDVVTEFGERGDPGDEAALEGFGVEGREQITELVMRRRAVLERREPPKEVELALAEQVRSRANCRRPQVPPTGTAAASHSADRRPCRSGADRPDPRNAPANQRLDRKRVRPEIGRRSWRSSSRIERTCIDSAFSQIVIYRFMQSP